MKKKHSAALAGYIRGIADLMELRDWEFVLEPTATDQSDEALAMIVCTDGRKLASIAVCAGFRDMEPEKQRHVLVHELVHCHLAPLQHQIDDDLAALIGRAAESVWHPQARRNLEYAVDALASALAPHFPLINWPK